MADRDSEAFRTLYRAHYSAVCRYLAARAEADVIEDVAAETFLVAWRRRHELPDHLRPWLLNTAAKCLSNQRRTRERSAALVERLSVVARFGGADADDHELVRTGQRRALLTALAELDERDRELLLLHHWDGLPPREIATVLELNPVATRQRLHRAGRRLQHALGAALAREGAAPKTVELMAQT